MSRHGAGFWGTAVTAFLLSPLETELSKPRRGLLGVGPSLLSAEACPLSGRPRDSLEWLGPGDPGPLCSGRRAEAYKAVAANTGQERFNVIRDLLELSPRGDTSCLGPSHPPGGTGSGALLSQLCPAD